MIASPFSGRISHWCEPTPRHWEKDKLEAERNTILRPNNKLLAKGNEDNNPTSFQIFRDPKYTRNSLNVDVIIVEVPNVTPYSCNL